MPLNARTSATAPAPDEVNARLLRTEGVVSTLGMAQLGQRGLDALNRGESPTPTGPIVIVPMYRHREFGALVADNLQLPSSPLTTAIASEAARPGLRGL